MKNILLPLKNGTLTQNYNSVGNLDGQTYLQRFGTKTHAGVDFASKHGDPIYASEDGTVCSVYDLNTQSLSVGLSRGFGIYFVTPPDEQGVCCSWGFWHTMSNITKKSGDVIKQSDIIAYEGDSGQVYENGIAVPDNEKGKPPYKGTHVHWNCRQCRRVKKPDNGAMLIAKPDGTAYTDSEGFVYPIINYGNGNKGFIDPMSTFNTENYNEWLAKQAVEVAENAVEIAQQLPDEQKNSFLQIVFNFLKSIWSAIKI